MPRTIPLLPFLDFAGKNVPCTRNGFPHYSVFINALLPTPQVEGLHINPIVLKLRGGKRFELIVWSAQIGWPAFKEHYRIEGIVRMADSHGNSVQVRPIEINLSTGDGGRRVCYVKFPELP
jgi:hypothetical protein